MNFTPLSRPYFAAVDGKMIASTLDPERSQRRLLADLIRSARTTEWGKDHGYRSVITYNDYRNRVPLTEYEQIRPLVMRMINGERDILWPGITRRFAQSSGTSGGKSKYIPLTCRSLKRCHYRGGADVVARYLSIYPKSRLFSGRGLILGGSYANELTLPPSVRVGDLSASLIDCINPIANLFRTPSKEIALMERWDEKLDRISQTVCSQNVTNLSGVPSWFLTVIKHIMNREGAEELHQIWPDLEVFFHGGISFGPYREQYDRLIDPSRMRYMETYNASEGFFALQADPDDKAMMLLLDTDVFYEFIPLDKIGQTDQTAIPIWEVSKGTDYVMVITSSNGLWRYAIGDTVRVENTDPVKIRITGRTKSYINAFGEELMVHNTDAAISRACSMTGARISDYTAGPVYAGDETKGCHQWLIEFNKQPDDMERFTDLLDKSLQEENSDYQAKRSGDLFLDRPRITAVPEGTFDRWLSTTGKLGGQRKVPRLRNDRSVIDSINELLQTNE